MPHASTWWGESRDASLRYKPYLRDGSVAGRPGPNSSSDDQLRTEIDLHAMAPNRGHYLGHHFGHHLGPERSKAGTEMRWLGPATPKQWGEDGTRPRCSEMRALIDDGHPK